MCCLVFQFSAAGPAWLWRCLGSFVISGRLPRGTCSVKTFQTGQFYRAEIVSNRRGGGRDGMNWLFSARVNLWRFQGSVRWSRLFGGGLLNQRHKSAHYASEMPARQMANGKWQMANLSIICADSSLIALESVVAGSAELDTISGVIVCCTLRPRRYKRDL